jgi:regulator of replication initiation timing
VRNNIYKIVHMIVKYGLSDENSKYLWSRIESILGRLNDRIISLMRLTEKGWRSASVLYKELILFAEMYVAKLKVEERNNPAVVANNDEAENKTAYSLNFSTDSQQQPVTTNVHLGESIQRLRKADVASYSNADDPFRFLREKQNLTTLCVENKELWIENEKLRARVHDFASREKDLKQKIELMESESQLRKEEVQKLREKFNDALNNQHARNEEIVPAHRPTSKSSEENRNVSSDDLKKIDNQVRF